MSFDFTLNDRRRPVNRVLFGADNDDDRSVPTHIPGAEGTSMVWSDDFSLPTFRVLAPPITREYRKQKVKDMVDEWNEELLQTGEANCCYCGRHLCPDRWDVSVARCRMEYDGVVDGEDLVYDRSALDFAGNALRRQLFFEQYWKTSRKTYDSTEWTSDDFMYIPSCAMYASRKYWPAPMDVARIPFPIEQSLVDRCNKGLLHQAPIDGSKVMEEGDYSTESSSSEE